MGKRTVGIILSLGVVLAACNEGGEDDTHVCPEQALLAFPVASGVGEQVVPRVVAGDSGTTWVSYYSADSLGGQYDLHIQALDVAGQTLFGPTGLTVSQHPSRSWVTTHALVSDHAGSAITILNDVRSGNFDVFAYKVSPEGGQEWGLDGEQLSDSPVDDLAPQAVICDADEVVVVWPRVGSGAAVPSVAVVQRLSTAGSPLWGDGIVIAGNGGADVEFPTLTLADEDSTIVVWMEGSAGSSDRWTLTARKLDPQGRSVWGRDITVQPSERMIGYAGPAVESDGEGGAFVAWTSLSSSATPVVSVQHVDSAGELTFGTRGWRPAVPAGRSTFSPTLGFVPSASELLLVWRETNWNQSEAGLRAQRLTEGGEPAWPAAGLELIPMSSAQVWPGASRPTPNGAMVFYTQQDGDGAAERHRLLVSQLGLVPDPTWAPIEIASSPSPLTNPDVDSRLDCGAWISWESDSQGTSDIFAAFLRF